MTRRRTARGQRPLPTLAPSLLALNAKNPALTKALGHPLAVAAGPDDQREAVAAHLAASQKGHESSHRGHRAELVVIARYHAAALARGVARLQKIHTPAEWIDGQLQLVARSTVDCMGHLLVAPHTAIYEEIKSTTRASSDVRREAGRVDSFPVARVKSHQQRALADAHREGQLALLTLLFGPASVARVYVVPWAEVADQSRLDESDVADWRVTPATYLTRVLAYHRARLARPHASEEPR